MEFFVLGMLMLLHTGCLGHSVRALDGNCDVPADIVFILDESNSIPPDDFIKQLTFVNKVVNHFKVDEDNMHIGVMSFGRGVNTDILALGELLHSKDALKSRILAYQDERGSNNDRTRTDLALEHARTDMFSIARPNVPLIAIVITDGEPNLPTGTEADGRRITKEKAELLKATGVTLFAIGVGRDSNRDQLLEMATRNSDQYVFLADNYSVLDEIEGELTTKICPKLPNIDGCDSNNPLDVMFVAANEAGVADTDYTLKLFTGLTGHMIIGEDRAKVALAPRNCLDLDGFLFDNYAEKLTLEIEIRNRRLQGTNLAGVLEDIIGGFEEGGRPYGAQPGEDPIRIALLVVDNRIADAKKVEKLLRELTGERIRLFVVGVGEHVEEAELKAIAATENHYFYANSYRELPSLVQRIIDGFCTELSAF